MSSGPDYAPDRTTGAHIDDAFYRDADGHHEFTPHSGRVDKIGAASGYRDRVEVFAFAPDGGRVLVNREPEGRLSFPGGGRDGASINEAAHKETAEETGFRVTNLRPAGPAPRPVMWPEEVQKQQAEKGRPFLGERTAWRAGVLAGTAPGFDSEGDGKKNLGMMDVDRVLSALNTEYTRATDPAAKQLLATRIHALESAVRRARPKSADSVTRQNSWFRPDIVYRGDETSGGGDHHDTEDTSDRKTVDQVLRDMNVPDDRGADTLLPSSTVTKVGRLRWW